MSEKKPESIAEALDALIKYFERAGDIADLGDHWAWEYHAADEIREWRKEEGL